MFEYIVTIESHRIVALIEQFGLDLCRFYIDGVLCDTYDADNFNPWKDDELWPGLCSPRWKTILRGPIIRADGVPALVEFQIRSGMDDVYDRILCGGKKIKRWKNKRG